jgi:hypothetical protein
MFLQFKYIFQVKSDCRRRIFMNENLIRIPEGTPRAEFVFGIVSELFRNRTMTEIRLPFFVIGVRCPCYQEQRSDTGYEGAGFHCITSQRLPLR